MTGYRKSAPRSRRLFGGPALPPPEIVEGSPAGDASQGNRAAGGRKDLPDPPGTVPPAPPRLLVVQGELRVVHGGAIWSFAAWLEWLLGGGEQRGEAPHNRGVQTPAGGAANGGSDHGR